MKRRWTPLPPSPLPPSDQRHTPSSNICFFPVQNLYLGPLITEEDRTFEKGGGDATDKVKEVGTVNEEEGEDNGKVEMSYQGRPKKS